MPTTPSTLTSRGGTKRPPLPTRTQRTLSRWAWIPVPVLAVAQVFLEAWGPRISFESWGALFVFSFLITTVASLIVSVLAARTFLITGAAGMLFLGMGVLMWGSAGTLGPIVLPNNDNAIITTHNLLAFLCALCHLAGVVVSRRALPTPRFPELVLTVGYALAAGAIAIVMVVVAAGGTPIFFIQGQGGTPWRYAVIGAAIGMFVATALLLHYRYRSAATPFSRWYSLGLLLIATGLFGILIQSVHGGWVGWTGRAAQWLGSAYMIVAALASVRESGAWKISLQAAVRQSEERYRALVELSPDAIFIDRDDRIVFANPAALGIFGATSADQVLGESPLSFFHPDSHYLIRDRIGRLLVGERVAPIEGKVVQLGGKVVYVEAAAAAFDSDEGRAVQVIVRDITERKKAIEQIRESEALVRSVTDYARVGLVMLDEERRYVFANSAYGEILRLPSQSIVGRRVPEVLGPLYETQIAPRLDQAFAGERVIYELRITGKEEMFYEVTYEPRLHTPHGARVIVVVVDVTARKSAEAMIRQQNERLEAAVAERTAALRETVQQLETFSYSLVHDMRAPLRTMRSFASFVRDDYGDKLDDRGRDYLSRVMSGAERLDTLINDVLSYSRVSKGEASLDAVDLNRLVRDIIREYPDFHAAEQNIEVRGPLPTVIGNAALLTQCFSNLLGNALKFVPKGKTPHVIIRSESSSGPVRIWVEDNGIGLPVENREKLFGLFQRLDVSSLYAGTGVGLAIVKRAVERMNGAVGVESEPGRGTRFWIDLPGR